MLARFEPEDVAGFGFVRQFGDDGSKCSYLTEQMCFLGFQCPNPGVGVGELAFEGASRRAAGTELLLAGDLVDGPVSERGRNRQLGGRLAVTVAKGSPFFTNERFEGHSSVLVRASRLREIGKAELTELIQDAWLSRASKRRADQWLAEHEG